MVDGCTRKSTNGRLCRKHLREDQRRSNQHFTESWNLAVLDAARQASELSGPDTIPLLNWGIVVGKVLAEFVKEPSLERRGVFVRDMPTVLAMRPAGHPVERIFDTPSGPEIRAYLRRIVARANESFAAFQAGFDEATTGDAPPNLPPLRELLDGLEIDAECLDAFGVGGTMIESCTGLRETLSRLEAAGTAATNTLPPPPSPLDTNLVPPGASALGARDAARLAADFVRAHHLGDTDAMVKTAVGHDGGMLAGELAIGELVWTMFRDHTDNESVCQIFDQLVAAATERRGIQTAVQLVSDRLNLPFQRRWLGADERELSADEVRDTNFALASVIDLGVSALGGDDSTRWGWMFDQLVQVVLTDMVVE